MSLPSLFLYCLLRDVTLLKLALLCGVIGFAYVISKIPSKYLAGAKYPLIGLSLAASPALILYPGVRLHLMVAAGAVLLTFYSVALFLVTLEEKPKKHPHGSGRSLGPLRSGFCQSPADAPF